MFLYSYGCSFCVQICLFYQFIYFGLRDATNFWCVHASYCDDSKEQKFVTYTIQYIIKYNISSSYSVVNIFRFLWSKAAAAWSNHLTQSRTEDKSKWRHRSISKKDFILLRLIKHKNILIFDTYIIRAISITDRTVKTQAWLHKFIPIHQNVPKQTELPVAWWAREENRREIRKMD
jgi:hypothetical protein